MLRKVLAAVIVIFLVVMPHELGHFAAARVSGVGVERLSIGFGPTVWCARPSVTEYCLSWIPIGGYVELMDQVTARQYSRQDLLRIASERRTYFTALADRDGWISQQTPLVQFSIAACGTLVNFLFVILIAPLLMRFAIGPIGLLKIAGRTGERGPAAVLSLTARFSIAIGVLQLWPIPFFDGKHLVDSFFLAVGNRQFLMLLGMGVWISVLRVLFLMAKQRLLVLQGVLVLKKREGATPIQRFIERMLK
jgi:membrane-associated protease RseP (regulator of RpoE activity)